MTRLLVVRAHPFSAPRSRTMSLVDTFLDAHRDAQPDVDITELHLYDVAIPEIDLDLLEGWRKLGAGTPFIHLHETEQSKVTLFNHYTEQFLAADKVVVANPLWNLQVPTRLKAWVDTITVAGKTFAYNESGEGVGLVHGKKVLHLQTAGGVFRSQDPASQYLKMLFGFIGVTDFEQFAAEGMDHDPAHADEIMADAHERIREVGGRF